VTATPWCGRRVRIPAGPGLRFVQDPFRVGITLPLLVEPPSRPQRGRKPLAVWPQVRSVEGQMWERSFGVTAREGSAGLRPLASCEEPVSCLREATGPASSEDDARIVRSHRDLDRYQGRDCEWLSCWLITRAEVGP
jgi:hypothetical protein